MRRNDVGHAMAAIDYECRREGGFVTFIRGRGMQRELKRKKNGVTREAG